MEPVYDIIALLIVIFIGYISEEKTEYFLFLLVFLIPAGLLAGYFLEDVFIYGMLFVLGCHEPLDVDAHPGAVEDP